MSIIHQESWGRKKNSWENLTFLKTFGHILIPVSTYVEATKYRHIQ